MGGFDRPGSHRPSFQGSAQYAGHQCFLVRQAAVIDIEIRVENRATLGAQKRGLGLDPLAGSLLSRIAQQAGLQIIDDVRVLVRHIVLLARVPGEVEQLHLAGKQRHLEELPVTFADGAAEGLDVDQDVLVRRRLAC